ncbi:MAG: ATP-binding protein [Candidatus Korobacteraceae bacterium]
MTAHSNSGHAGAGQDRADTQANIFGRSEELEALHQQLARRRSFLFHGPAGVGKTLLLSAELAHFPDILYSRSNPTPQALYGNVAELLLAAGHPVFTRSCPNGSMSLQAKSVVSLKGLVRDALLNSKYLVVLDHLMRPSQTFAASIRELMLNWSVPAIAVSRSAHMEDVGFVLPLFADRSDRFAMRNFDPDLAEQFAATYARREGLDAENLAQFLERIVGYSEGNPGAMLRMIRLARDPRYLHENQIKIAPLYIDYKIAMVSK